MAALFSSLINRHEQKKVGRFFYKCRPYTSGSERHQKAKEAK